MPTGEIEQKTTLSRRETARWLAELARAIGEGGTLDVALAGPPVTLNLPEEFRCELEVQPDANPIELEIELKWPQLPSGQDRAYAQTHPGPEK